jgi:hypothetical protein
MLQAGQTGRWIRALFLRAPKQGCCAFTLPVLSLFSFDSAMFTPAPVRLTPLHFPPTIKPSSARKKIPKVNLLAFIFGAPINKSY